MTQIQTFFTWASVAAALVSSALWFAACFVRVKFNPTPDADGWVAGGIVDEKGNDKFASADRATNWNAWAAGAAGVAALCQGIASALATQR